MLKFFATSNKHETVSVLSLYTVPYFEISLLEKTIHPVKSPLRYDEHHNQN